MGRSELLLSTYLSGKTNNKIIMIIEETMPRSDGFFFHAYKVEQIKFCEAKTTNQIMKVHKSLFATSALSDKDNELGQIIDEFHERMQKRK